MNAVSTVVETERHRRLPGVCWVEEGLTFVIQPGKTFQELAKNEIEGRTLASLAAIEGALFLRADTHLFRIATSE